MPSRSQKAAGKSKLPLTIGINGYYLQNLPSGIGQYTHNMLRGLATLDKNNQYLIFVPFNARTINQNIKLPKNFKVIQTGNDDLFKNSYVFRTCWEQWILPLALRKHGVGVYHSPYQSIPIFGMRKIKSMVTIHDAIPWFFDFQRRDRQHRIYSAISKYSCRRANKKITISESAKLDIIPVYKFRQEMIEVVREAVSPIFHNVPSPHQIRSTLKKYGITQPYMLSSGGVKRHKNLRILIKSFAAFVDKHGDDTELVILGSARRNTTAAESIYYSVEALRGYAKGKKVAKKVRFLGKVSEAELLHLYHGASMLVTLSLREGFGLPVLEAMTCGIPVIASKIPAHYEIAGRAAIFVNPFGSNEISSKMKLLTENKEVRKKLVRRGKERAAEFDLEDFASRIHDIYEELYSDSNLFITRR